MMTKTQTSLLFVSLLATSQLALADNALHGVQLDARGVELTVQGQSTLTLPNDEAVLTWQATSQAATVEEATSRVFQQVNDGAADIDRFATDAQKQTLALQTYPVYSEKKGNIAPKIIAWRVSQTFKVKTQKLELIPKMITETVGTVELTGMQFQVSDETTRSMQETLVKDAIAEATHRAVWSAKAMGLTERHVKLTKLDFQPTYSNVSSTRLMAMKASGTTDAMPMPTIEPGTSTLRLTVNAQAVIQR